MDTALEWKKVLGRRSTSGHSKVGGKRKQQKSWKNQVTNFMRSRNMEKYMAEDRYLWRLGMDRRLVAI